MWTLFAPILLLLHGAVAAPVENAAAAATVGKIRGVADPIFHLYLQANSKNGTYPNVILVHMSIYPETNRI